MSNRRLSYYGPSHALHSEDQVASGATPVQVVQYRHHKVVILKHIGSARTPEEMEELVQSADAWIERNFGQGSLFMPRTGSALPIARCTFVGVRHTVAYRTFMDVVK